jgi:hypothetical protein
MKSYVLKHAVVFAIAFLASLFLMQLAANGADCPDKGNRGCFPVDTVGGVRVEIDRGSGRYGVDVMK